MSYLFRNGKIRSKINKVLLGIRKAQQKILKIFSEKNKSFALSGGSALELYYLNHRFSADLDFFSPKYNNKEVDEIVSEFRKYYRKIKLESEFISSNRARVRFYTIPIKGEDRPLKIDFVEDVIFKVPKIRRFGNVPVYDIENIYLQKIAAIAGTHPSQDIIGRQIIVGGR